MAAEPLDPRYLYKVDATHIDMIALRQALINRLSTINESEKADKIDCPSCGKGAKHGDRHAAILSHGWQCHVCKEKGGLVDLARRVGYDYEQHRIAGEAPPYEVGSETAKTRVPLAAPVIRNAAIRKLLDLVPQTEANIADLTRRGFYGDPARNLVAVDSERIAHYRTLPADETARRSYIAALEAVDEKGNGLVVPTKEDFAGLAFVTAVRRGRGIARDFNHLPPVDVPFYPALDAWGNAVALQRSTEYPVRGKLVKSKLWISGGAGASVGNVAHVATPVAPAYYAGAGLTVDNTVIVTGGIKKADLAAARLGYWTIGAGGEGATIGATIAIMQHDLPAARGISPRHVLLAIDADWRTIPGVRISMERAAAEYTANGFTVSLLLWPLEEGKGIDDYTLESAHADPAQHWHNLKRVPFLRVVEPGDDAPVAPSRGKVKLYKGTQPVTTAAAPTALLTLQEGQAAHVALAKKILTASEPGITVDAGVTGTGKTTGTLIALADLAHTLTTNPPATIKRSIVLLDKKDEIYTNWLYDEIPGVRKASPLKQYADAGIVAVRLGRQPSRPDGLPVLFECRHTDKTQEAGERRIITAPTICRECPDAKVKRGPVLDLDGNETFDTEGNTIEADLPDWACERDGYLGDLKKTAKAPIVIATKDAIMTGAQEIDGFTNIIFDEGIAAPNVLETVKMSVADVTGLRLRLSDIQNTAASNERKTAKGKHTDKSGKAEVPFYYNKDNPPAPSMTFGGLARPFADLYELTDAVLFDTATENDAPTVQPLAHALAAKAKERLLDMGDLLQQARKNAPHLTHERQEALSWERIDSNGVWEQKHRDYEVSQWPKRITNALLDTLATEHERAAGADFRALVVKVGTSAHIELRIPRENIQKALKAATVFMLDATPDVPLIMLATGLKPTVHTFDVPQHMHVTQVIDGLFKGAALRDNPALAQQVAAAIANETAATGAKEIATFVEKAANPDTARYNTESLEILNGLRTRLAESDITLRYSHFWKDHRASNAYQTIDMLNLIGHPQEPPDQIKRVVHALRYSELPHIDGVDRRIARYETVEGIAPIALWRAQSGDSDVDAMATHAIRANILQAIGRGRASHHTAAKPLHVYLYGAEPIEGLRVDRLVYLRQLAGETRATVNQLAALDEGRSLINDTRQEEARQRVYAYLAATAYEDNLPSPTRMQRELGGKWDVIKDHRAAFVDLFRNETGRGDVPALEAISRAEAIGLRLHESYYAAAQSIETPYHRTSNRDIYKTSSGKYPERLIYPATDTPKEGAAPLPANVRDFTEEKAFRAAVRQVEADAAAYEANKAAKASIIAALGMPEPTRRAIPAYVITDDTESAGKFENMIARYFTPASLDSLVRNIASSPFLKEETRAELLAQCTAKRDHETARMGVG